MKVSIFLIMSLFVSSFAHAGFLAEPWVGYESGSTACTGATSGSDCAAKSSGAKYGARLGWMIPMGMWFAAEYMGGSSTLKYDDGSADDTGEHTVLGAALGYDFGSGLRLFAAYGASNTMKVKSSVEITFKGTNTRAGVGYKFNHFSVNLEYHMDTFTKLDSPSQNITDMDVSTVFSKFSPTGMMLTFSYIFGSGK
jgi:hypothetical protein